MPSRYQVQIYPYKIAHTQPQCYSLRMVNKVTIIGNLGADPDVRQTNSGSTVCELRVATEEKWKDKNGELHEHTEWHRVQVWGKQAEACGKYLTKGKKVYVEGSIRTRTWDDADGNTRYMTEIRANKVLFLSPRSDGQNHSSSQPPPPTPSGQSVSSDFGPDDTMNW